MDRRALLTASRADLTDLADRLVDLLRAQPHLDVPLGGGSTWTVRDAAAHLSAAGLYADLAAGVPSPVTTLEREAMAAMNRQYGDDIAETDPGKLADLVATGVERLLVETAGWSADQPVGFHAGTRTDLAGLITFAVQEIALHGYDVASALGAPWPIEPGLAARATANLLPLLGLMPNPAADPRHTAAYAVELRGRRGILTARFTDGRFAVEAFGGRVDCVVSAEPAALLLVLTGRMPVWTAAALGSYSGDGDSPELAHGFPGRFQFC